MIIIHSKSERGNLGKEDLWSQFYGDHFVFSSLKCQVYAYLEVPDEF
jgi:hypothetical protein